MNQQWRQDLINDNRDNYRANRTAKQIVRPKGDKNSLARQGKNMTTITTIKKASGG